jgi:hypothetical protein
MPRLTLIDKVFIFPKNGIGQTSEIHLILYCEICGWQRIDSFQRALALSLLPNEYARLNLNLTIVGIRDEQTYEPSRFAGANAV